MPLVAEIISFHFSFSSDDDDMSPSHLLFLDLMRGGLRPQRFLRSTFYLGGCPNKGRRRPVSPDPQKF